MANCAEEHLPLRPTRRTKTRSAASRPSSRRPVAVVIGDHQRSALVASAPVSISGIGALPAGAIPGVAHPSPHVSTPRHRAFRAPRRHSGALGALPREVSDAANGSGLPRFASSRSSANSSRAACSPTASRGCGAPTCTYRAPLPSPASGAASARAVGGGACGAGRLSRRRGAAAGGRYANGSDAARIACATDWRGITPCAARYWASMPACCSPSTRAPRGRTGIQDGGPAR
jgi:hypothetical protein